MKLWLNIKDLFSFQPNSYISSPTLLAGMHKELMDEGHNTLNQSQIQSIRFDNSMRVLISIVALIAAVSLWLGKVIPVISPIVIVFTAYAALQVLINFSLMKWVQYRGIYFVICTIDIVAMSLGIYWTGNTTSPLYFIYFMPLIIQAFHRDWALLVYYGAGGLVLYTAVIACSVHHWDSAIFINLGTRVSFMALTVGIALLAVNLLRKNEVREKRRMARLKCLVFVSQELNAVGRVKDLPDTVEEFVKVINHEMQDTNKSWSRIFLIQNGEPLMQVVQDPGNPHPELKQSIPHTGCPAIQGNKNFEIKDTENEAGCPMESFSMFKSHTCVPITGELNESFGVIFSGSPLTHAFGEEDIQFLQFIGKSIGLTIQRLKRVEELSLMSEMDSCAMATFLGSIRTMDDTVGAIIEGIKTILGADLVQLMLWDPLKGRLLTKAVIGLNENSVRNQSYSIGEGIPGRVLESGKPYWTYNLHSNSIYEEATPFRGLLAVPLLTLKGEPLGVVTASVVSGQRTFSIEEIDLISTFCTRAAVAIENARLHLKERQPASPDEENLSYPTDRAA